MTPRSGLVPAEVTRFNRVMPDNYAQIIADAVARLVAHDRAGAGRAPTGNSGKSPGSP